MTNLPEPLQYHACVIYKNKITVSGGSTGSRSNKVWQYEGGRWVPLPPMKNARNAHQMAVLDGDLYVFGGDGARKGVEKLVVNGNGNEWIEQKGLQEEFLTGGVVTLN